MVGAEYTIYKRDSEGKRGNLIDKFTLLKIEQRWTEPSKWSLDSTGLSRIPIAIGDGIIIYRNGELLLSGIVEAASEHCNEAEQGIITWHAEGRDMTSLLERRLALPDPVGLQFDESIQDVLVDSAEGAIRRYVERNAGASAATGRRLNGLVVDQIAPDPNGDMRAYRLQTLDKVCAEIGEGELSPEITWSPETGVMEFEVHPRREKADDVVFSPEYGTVIRWDIKQKLPKKNAIWAISGGNDQVVTFSKHDESIAAFGRFEGFIKDSAQVQEAKDDQPAVTAADVTNILLSKANEELRKNAATKTYTVEVREGVNTLFYEHWRCGDRVTCVIDGESIISTIDSVSIVFADDGEKVQATIGDVEKGIFASLFEDIAELQKAVVTEQAVSSAAAITGGGSSEFETSAANIKQAGTASVGSLSTVPRADHVHPIEDTGWINATLLNGWTGSVTYRKIDGLVEVFIKGLSKSANSPAWEIICVFPSGFIPQESIVEYAYVSSATGMHQILINSAVGNLQTNGIAIPANTPLSKHIIYFAK